MTKCQAGFHNFTQTAILQYTQFIFSVSDFGAAHGSTPHQYLDGFYDQIEDSILAVYCIMPASSTACDTSSDGNNCGNFVSSS